jgi:nitrogen fixation NifU-like protein
MVRIELAIAPDGTIHDAYFDGDGCLVSRASASMLIEQINGKHVDDIKAFTARDMLNLFGAKLMPRRQNCCLLSWRALQSAVYSPIGADPGPGPGGDPRRLP